MRYIKRGAGISTDSINGLSNTAGISTSVAELLLARGIASPEEAARFFRPDEGMLIDPQLFDAAEETAELIGEILEAGVPIAIYSDYDCDGVCGAAILYKTITALGGETRVYIPDRFTEGYGTNKKAFELLCEECGLIITVDCGITSVEDVAYARDQGVEVVILDHHECGELPDTPYIWNPHRPGESYPFKDLCGAGIAFKLACLLLGEDAMQLIDIAAVATVGDMVSLTGENRAIAALGMKKLRREPCPGLRALCVCANVKTESISSQTLGFGLAPRLNVAGRLESAFRAFDLLTADSAEKAKACAEYLQELNDKRRAIQRSISSLAEQQALLHAEDRVIIVKGEGFHKGVVGLAASNIAEKFHRPTVVLSEEDGMLTGSARSIKGVSIYDLLNSFSGYTRFGGHEQAAGLSLPSELFEDFCTAVQSAAEGIDARLLVPSFTYDALLRAKDVTEELTEAISAMEPFGQDNPQPVFLIRDAFISDSRRIGRALDSTRAETEGLQLLRFFGELEKGERYTLAGSPEMNEFNGKRSLQFRVSFAEPEDKLYLRSFIKELTALFEARSADGLFASKDFFAALNTEKEPVLIVGSLPGERMLEQQSVLRAKVIRHGGALPEGCERVYLLGCFAQKEKYPGSICLYDEGMQREYIKEARRYFVPERALSVCLEAFACENGEFESLSALMAAASARVPGSDIRRMWFAFNVFFEQKLLQLKKGDKIQAIYKKSGFSAADSAIYRAFESFAKGDANARLL